VSRHPVHILATTRDIFYFSAMAPEGGRKAALALERRARALFSPRPISGLPKVSCTWKVERVDADDLSSLPSEESKGIWLELSNPIVNPFAARRGEVGVFVRAGYDLGTFMYFARRYFWVTLRLRDGTWTAVDVRPLPIRDM